MKKLEQDFVRLSRQAERTENVRVKQTLRESKRLLDNIRSELSQVFEKHAVDGSVPWSEMVKYDRLAKMDKRVQELVYNMYNENQKGVRAMLNEVARDTYNGVIGIAEAETGRKLTNVVKKLSVSKVVNDDMAGLNWATRMGKHRSDLVYAINSELRAGLKAGHRYSEISNRLKEVMEIDANKSRVIIRTEGHRVLSQSRKDSLDAISNQGIKMMKTWVSSSDERVRPMHEEMDGVTIPYDELFVLPDGATCSAPALTGEPQHDINCRCIITVQMETDGED